MIRQPHLLLNALIHYIIGQFDIDVLESFLDFYKMDMKRS